MSLPTLGGLTWVPALDRPDLLASPVLLALRAWADVDDRVAGGVAVAAIDPDHADTATLNEVHGLPPEASANCVLVAGRRGEVERIAACVIPATTSADVNTRVRKLLDVRKASFLPRERAVAESGQEYGGIGPLGLPPGWRLLVDARFTRPGSLALQGSGVRHSKLLMPGELLCEIPGAEVVDGLGIDRDAIDRDAIDRDAIDRDAVTATPERFKPGDARSQPSDLPRRQ